MAGNFEYSTVLARLLILDLDGFLSTLELLFLGDPNTGESRGEPCGEPLGDYFGIDLLPRVLTDLLISFFCAGCIVLPESSSPLSSSTFFYLPFSSSELLSLSSDVSSLN